MIQRWFNKPAFLESISSSSCWASAMLTPAPPVGAMVGCALRSGWALLACFIACACLALARTPWLLQSTENNRREEQRSATTRVIALPLATCVHSPSDGILRDVRPPPLVPQTRVSGRLTPCPRGAHGPQTWSAQRRTGGAPVLGTPSHNCRLDECRRRARQAIAWLCGGVTESRKWLRVDRSREPTLGTVLETPDAMPDFRWLDQNWTVGKKKTVDVVQ